MTAHEHHDDLVHNLREMGGHLAKDTTDSVARAASGLAHSAAELLESTKKQAGAAAKKVGGEIKAHPVTSAAIVAAAVGLIGYALAHQRKHES